MAGFDSKSTSRGVCNGNVTLAPGLGRRGAGTLSCSHAAAAIKSVAPLNPLGSVESVELQSGHQPLIRLHEHVQRFTGRGCSEQSSSPSSFISCLRCWDSSRGYFPARPKEDISLRALKREGGMKSSVLESATRTSRRGVEPQERCCCFC